MSITIGKDARLDGNVTIRKKIDDITVDFNIHISANIDDETSGKKYDDNDKENKIAPIMKLNLLFDNDKLLIRDANNIKNFVIDNKIEHSIGKSKKPQFNEYKYERVKEINVINKNKNNKTKGLNRKGMTVSKEKI